MDRRKAIGAGVLGAVGVVGAGHALAHLVGGEEKAARAGVGPADAVPFYGANQAGIVTPVQDHLHFVSFDVITSKRAELVDMLQNWTLAAARMTSGRDAGPIGAVGGLPEAPPDDTGEAIDLPPAGLTLTIGFGATLFRDAAGRDRFGLADRKPAALADLPKFPGEAIEAGISGGDLCIQACANDPQVAVHAVRNLARIGMGVVTVRWSQLGFGRTSMTTVTQGTARNLFGFKDGTRNLKVEDGALLRDNVWVPAGGDPAWMAGGSYVVTRKIRMLIETWDRTSLVEQEAIVGRAKGSGAPLGRQNEFEPADFGVVGDDGEPVIAEEAHIRLAHPDNNNGARMLRRGYNFVDGSDGLGRLNAGLFFIAYLRDPHQQFVPVQQKLARHDVMNEYIRHVSSAVFACPAGVRAADDH